MLEAQARIRALVDAARAHKLVVGGSRDITRVLGELYACTRLRLDQAADNTAAYDARDKDGHRIQIKSRAPERGDHVNPIGTVGRFTRWDFDYAVLIMLDSEHGLDEVWLAEPQVLEPLQAKVRNTARGIRVSDFTRVARRLDIADDVTPASCLRDWPLIG